MAAASIEDITKHSVHTLVFRSIKRTHDMFLADHALPIPPDKSADELKRRLKILSEYPHLVTTQDFSKHTQNDHYPIASLPLALNASKDPQLAITGPHQYPSGPGISLSANNAAAQRHSSGRGKDYVQSLQPISYASSESNKIAPGIREITEKALASGGLERIAPKKVLGTTGESKIPFSQGIVPRKATTMPKPKWHAPWKLMRVISGHTGWVRCVAVEPANQWFCTGAADRTIKIWDLATCKLKLSLTGHISTVRGLVVSPRHPYLFSCGEDKTVKCWDLEYNKVTRHYHGHLSAVYGIDVHPTVDVLVTCGRDATARVWDIRTKSCVHTLTGHTNTVADVKCQGVQPQVVTGSHDCTVRYWDLAAGKSLVTLTNHKKSIRSLVLHPNQYTMASASADNIKQWKFPDGNFIQNFGGHNAIINCLAVNSDGVLVSGGDNGSMHFWDWKTGYNFQRAQAIVQPGSLDSESGMFSMTFDMSGTRLLTTEADKTIKVYKEDDTANEENNSADVHGSKSNTSMTDINARKEQARKEREKKAAAQATAKQYKFSDQLKFNLKPRQNNDNESFLSKSVKHVLGDFHAFKSALRGNQEALFLGLDSSVPGTPEVKEFESDPLIIDNLLKPKNGIINHQQNQHLKKLIKNGVRSDFVQPKTKTDKTLTQKIIKHKPPKLKVPIACGGEHSPLGRLQEPKIEKILKEMTQCLPPLLSDIETPVKQAGFVFPKVAHPKTIESNNTLLKVKKEEEEEQVFNKSSEKHQSKDENSNKVGKVLASTEVPTTKTTSPSRKLSSSSSSSDGSSSGSSASSDSEDEEIAKTEKHLQQTTSIKDMNNMNLNSPLLAAELPQKIRKGSPLNNNYLLNKSNINDAKIVNNSLKETALQQPTIMQKIDKKTEASIDNDNLNFFGWENEKVISPLDNNLFSDLGFIGSGEENFVDDIFKSNVDVVEEKDKKDESFVSDTVFDNDYEQKSLPNPCLPRRGPSLYRKDSEQNDGRNKSSNKSNETKDKSKSKSTRIDASHPSVKVNSGSIGHSCLTKAQLKMPHRKKSLSESSTASVEDSPVRKTSGKIKAPKKGSDIVSKKDTFNKRKSKPTDYSCVENNAESKNKTDFDNICNNEKIKTYLKPIPTSPTNFSPNHQPETDKSTFNRDISKMAASSQQLLLDVNVSKENEIKGLRAPVLSNTTSLLNVGDVNFDEHELETTHFDGKLFETSTVTSIISPLMSPVSTSMHISNISLDDRGSETLSFNSNLTFNHSLKPHLSPIKDLLSPINDFVDSVTSNFEESVSMEIDNDDNDMHAPLVVEEKPSVDNDDNDMHASLVLEEKPSVELAQIDDNSLQILKKESLLSEVRPQATCLIDFARPLETLSMEVQKEHVTDDDHNQIELKPCFTQLISTVYDKKMSPGNCFDVIKTFDVKAEALSCSELRVKIPLKSIRLKDSTRLKYKNRTSHFKNSSETLTSPSNEDELVDVEGIESPLKRKRKLSIGLASHSTVPTTSADNSSDLFKSPNSFNLHTLVVRINLSKLKRVPHKATSADAQGLKLLLEKPSKIAKTESETSIKVEPITNTEDFLQSGNCTSKGVVKENTTKVPNLSMSSSKPTRNSTDTVLKKKKRGRPPKEKDGSKITEIKTEIPSPHVQKNVNSVLEKHANACNGEIIGEKDELKDKNVCLECGILRRDASQDAKKLAGYKKTYSTYFNEGRRAKHRADCLKNPVEKAHTYIDAAVSYLQYLIGLESCGKLSTKQGVTEYTQITSSCIDLVEYVITRFGRKTNSNISYDGRFLFLCLRLQSILYLKLFNIKKDSAMKYSKIISEYFKQYKPSADPSPYHKPVQKVGSTGTPSPSSPSPGPSPGGSVASIGSAGSSCSAGSNEKTANGVPSTFVSIPSDMHEKTFQYVQYTKYLVHSHRLWDEAELLTLHSQVFLSHLSRHAAVLTLHSSMLHLVDYVNAGLKFIKDSPLS